MCSRSWAVSYTHLDVYKRQEYAQEGSDAHSLCEHRLKSALGMESTDPTEGLSFYNEEMEQCACDYAAYVMELVAQAKETCKDPVVLIEQRLDFSRFVQEGFGTGDCVIIADGTLYIVDYKHGKGVEVSAVDNPQMMLYACLLYTSRWVAAICLMSKATPFVWRKNIYEETYRLLWA